MLLSIKTKLKLNKSQMTIMSQQTQQDAIPQLLAMGLTVEQVAQALSLSVEEVQRLG